MFGGRGLNSTSPLSSTEASTGYPLKIVKLTNSKLEVDSSLFPSLQLPRFFFSISPASLKDIKGTLRSNNGGSNEDIKKAIGLKTKTTILHVLTFFPFLCHDCMTAT